MLSNAVPNSLTIIALSLVCLCTGNDALAFEVGRFKTGMERNAVALALALQPGVRVQKADPSTLIAIDRSGNASSYDLCNGALVSMELPQQADYRQFVRLVQEYAEKYGQPVAAADSSRPLPRDVVDAASLRWSVGQEYVTLHFTSSVAGDRVRLFYQSPNSCYSFPR